MYRPYRRCESLSDLQMPENWRLASETVLLSFHVLFSPHMSPEREINPDINKTEIQAKSEFNGLFIVFLRIFDRYTLKTAWTLYREPSRLIATEGIVQCDTT
jgi:hypothetical protein